MNSNNNNQNSTTSSISSPKLDYNYVVQCFRPNADKAPGAKATCVPGEESCCHRHEHTVETINPNKTFDLSSSIDRTNSHSYKWCINCTHESTAELNNENIYEQQS